MPRYDGKRLINQGQFRNIGNRLDERYVKHDAQNLENAIKTLQNKLKELNREFTPKAADKAKKNARRKAHVDNATFNDAVAKLGKASKSQILDFIEMTKNMDDASSHHTKGSSARDTSNGNTTTDNHSGPSSTNDKDHGDADHSSDESSHSDTTSPDKDNDHGDTDSSPADDKKDHDADLNFLNRVNK